LGEAEGDLHFCLGAKNAKVFYRIRRHGWQCAASLQGGAAPDLSVVACYGVLSGDNLGPALSSKEFPEIFAVPVDSGFICSTCG
jgi:hypothetical protein